MKKWKIMLSLFVLLLLFSQIGYAASNKTIQVSMNGTKISVKPVPIIMDGQAINTEFPSFVHTNRTLVPIRFVAENYGAEVGWDQKTKTAIVNYGDKEGKFTINSNIAIINGEKKTLDKYAIPRLVTLGNKDTRTMVPLRFVNELFGYEIGWDSAKEAPYINSKQENGIGIIKGISIGKGSTDKNKIVINSNKSIEYETMFLQDSNKLVIDIKDSKLDLIDVKNNQGIINVNDGIIENIEYSQFSSEPSITRVVIKLNQLGTHDISLANDGKDMVISFVNKVKSITKEIINGKEAIVIQGTSKPKVNLMKLKNPERVVVDLMDSSFEESTQYNYNYDLGFIKGVRASQFSGDNNYSSIDKIVRVVLDVKDGVTDPDIKLESQDNKIIIYPEKTSWENIFYTSEGVDKILTINNLTVTDYSVDYELGSKLIEITIPSENVKLDEGIIPIKDNLVDEVEIYEGKSKTTVSIKLKKDIEYVLLSREFDDKISLLLRKGENVKSTDRVIVVDAGHGGKDPGAISIGKRYEKDLSLSVSLKLNDALKAKGYNTIMTRDKDEFIDLYERARIANDNYADVFVSIHGNAHDNRSIAGIQVLYCPATNSSKKEVDQHPFAKIIMEELLKATGAADKGIIQRPNLVVLRETKMPAVLVETGFLSNEAEERLLYTEEYQYKIVDAIIKGIEKYFEMY
ncbi:N-acetylmuramoyl-L-alanine amidase family protein [Tissierella praeacuta]|uniref:N-acetylmuramoyl-L-alanine amidase family protein n=1 Tax=Tissierella praeacuta TaxID=43131 RepID=UPI001C0FDE1B|nr:N-acetylmuramoyl-L-alanine amidase family protein [Tissierella praeacuta]MBU5256132.1 N-acetylmuramoyl-L-alanine amidase family protein [Tissierella praeacuta]